MAHTSSEKLISEIVQIMQHKACEAYGHSHIKRSAHAASLATLKGTLTIEENLPQTVRVGLFEKAHTYPVWIRVSNSNPKVKNDAQRDVRGFAIQLQAQDQLQDFILASTPYMPLKDLQAFHAILSLSSGRQPIRSLLTLISHTHIPSIFKLLGTLKHESSPLDRSYYSITPYCCGNQVVKYSLIPTSSYKSKRPKRLTPTYLRDNMKRHLSSHQATFDLMIQLKKKGMSVENASDVWDEKVSPVIKVGKITIPPQLFDTPQRKLFGERLTFSPGHSLKEHRPVGTLNRARSVIYNEMQKFRKQDY